MPLEDGYQTERKLNKEAEEMAKALTDYIEEIKEPWNFSLFIVDRKTGLMQYISDINHDDAVRMVSIWVNRERL